MKNVYIRSYKSISIYTKGIYLYMTNKICLIYNIHNLLFF